MSDWSYIHGTIVVEPLGRTQHEKTYILNTVLDHLPRVTGSEGDMNVYVIPKKGHDFSQNCDEFGMCTNNLTDWYGNKSQKRGWLKTQADYILVVDGALRDRTFEETKREFSKWLCRLAKRVIVNHLCVELENACRIMLFKDDITTNDVFYNMWESPSWTVVPKIEIGNEPEPRVNWCEYLMWEEGIDSNLPMLLKYKYYDDKANDAAVYRRKPGKSQSEINVRNGRRKLQGGKGRNG